MAYVLGANAVKTPFPWLTQNGITQSFGEHGETGIDLGMVMGTPVTALVSGQVGGAAYDTTGGYASILFGYNGKPTALYYQHLDQVTVTTGQQVKVGDLIGYSGGQLSGGHHPATQGSTGPHLEVGFNFPYGGGRNPLLYTPSFDPLPLLQELAGGQPMSGLSGIGAMVVNTATTEPGFGALAQALNDTMQFRGVTLNDPIGDILANGQAFTSRAVFVVVGLVILIGVVSYLVRNPLAPVVRIGAAVAGA